MKHKRLSDQVLVITGASSGIGRATALAAARRGARVVLVARDGESLRDVGLEITQRGGRALEIVADVGSPEAVREVARVAESELGGFDTWVNNAGGSIFGRLEDVCLDDARRLFETNYWGVVHGSLVAAERLRERGGAIVNVGSALSDRSIPLQGHYCATKHAVKAFTDALRMELERDGAPVSVSLVKPSAIATPFPQHALNRLRSGEPALPPPVYAPELVAHAILECARRPLRDVAVGGGGRLLTVAGTLMPRMTDRFMEARFFEQQRRDGRSGANGRSTLHAASPGSGRVNGDHAGHVMRTSLYTATRLHPWRVALGVGAALGLAALVACGLGDADGRRRRATAELSEARPERRRRAATRCAGS
jgi:short-subunit dehydrogenase